MRYVALLVLKNNDTQLRWYAISWRMHMACTPQAFVSCLGEDNFNL